MLGQYRFQNHVMIKDFHSAILRSVCSKQVKPGLILHLVF